MSNPIRDNTTRNRFELDVDGDVAYIDYHRDKGVVTLIYAKVPERLQGGGIGARLVRDSLELVRSRGEKVIPRCAFVARYLRLHQSEYQDVMAQ